MYHCHIQIYCAGGEPGIFEPLKRMPPLERFSHTFLESRRPEAALLAQADAVLVAQADAVLADLRGMDAVQTLLERKNKLSYERIIR